MKLTATNRQRYPKTAVRINSLTTRLSARKYAAFEKHGHADQAKVKAAFDPNSGPDLGIVLLPVDKEGRINKETGNPEINEILVKAFEKGVVTGEQLDRIVEHELTHWFERAWAAANPGEMRAAADVGFKYEGEVYGSGWRPNYPEICRHVYGGDCPKPR
jgi:hypothetical protein